MIKFEQVGVASILTSITWRRFLPNENIVHAYGCRLAEGMNQRKKRNGRFSEKTRFIYCGAYAFDRERLGSLVASVPQVSAVDVRHQPEDGEVAHVDLRIDLSDVTGIEGTITAVIDRMWNAAQGPLRHVCDRDTATQPHPSQSLQLGPAGNYIDNASAIQKLGRAVRCVVLSLLWRLGCKAGKCRLEAIPVAT